MSLIVRMRKQTAVRWATTGVDQFGNREYSDPVEITVRWEDVADQFIDSKGEVAISQSKVYTGIDINLGDVLMLGTLNDITDEVNIKENSGAYEVRRFNKTPNLKATEFLREAIL